MRKYLRLAHQIDHSGLPKLALRCVMLGAIDAGAFDEAHQIAVEFQRHIGDDLVHRLQQATLAALERVRIESEQARLIALRLSKKTKRKNKKKNKKRK